MQRTLPLWKPCGCTTVFGDTLPAQPSENYHKIAIKTGMLDRKQEGKNQTKTRHTKLKGHR